MGRQARFLLGGAVVAVLVIVGLVLALSGDGKDRTGKKDRPGATTTTAATSPPATDPPATTTTAPAGFATPEDAIRDYIESQGNQYAGDCAGTSLEADVGKWCSALISDDGGTRTYGIGPTFSEGAEQLTLTRVSTSAGDRWEVTAHEALPPVGEL